MKNISKRKVSRKSTIKTKLILVPLVLVFITLAIVSYGSASFMKESMLDQMQDNGEYTSKQLLKRLEENDKALLSINNIINEKIRATGNLLVRERENLSNERLKMIAEDMGVHEINWFTANGTIVYSSIPEYVGWSVVETHPVYQVVISNEKEYYEAIRKDSEADVYLKYGYIKSNTGAFAQVGILADVIHTLTEEFGSQNLLDEITADEEIVYAMFLDKDATAIAHSNKELVGSKFDDPVLISAAADGVGTARELNIKIEGKQIYEYIAPAIFNGRHVGAVVIGYSMDKVNKKIAANTMITIIISSISFLVLGSIMFITANGAVKTIDRLKKLIGIMATGDFSQPVSEDLLSKTDEFGQISKAMNEMRNSFVVMVKSILDKSNQLAASSEELSAISEQSATSAEEVARTVEEIARGASSQAKDTEQGTEAVIELEASIIQNREDIVVLNKATEHVSTLKEQGLEILKDLIEKTNINSKSSKEVQEVIIQTNESAEKIVSASEMIKNIAYQTNLLALNAAIEAARAGESGKGFAVVAEQIRRLAEESNKFTKQISSVIGELTEKTSNAVQTMIELEKVVASQTGSVELTSKKFDGIAEAIEEMNQVIYNVNTASAKMMSKKDEIIMIMENLSAVSEENAAATQETSASVEEQTAAMIEISNNVEDLARIAEDLNQEVEKFKF